VGIVAQIHVLDIIHGSFIFDLAACGYNLLVEYDKDIGALAALPGEICQHLLTGWY